MKVLASLFGGALQLQEDAGTVSLVLDGSASVGGGSQAGVLAVEGQGKLVFKGKQEFDALMELLKAHSPAALVPAEAVVQALADAAIDKA